ncbi:MAG TPA: hypothetical protein VF132_11090 [Rudaea sp.]
MDANPLPQSTRDALARLSPRREWDGVAAVIAALVGLLALCVSGYTAYLQREQVRAQVWPYLEPGMSGSRREIILSNKGVGPAIIRNVQMTVDGKPQRNWTDVFHALGIHYDHHIPYSTINGIVLAGNDHIDQLLFPTSEDFNLYSHQARRVNLKVCYCSSLGDCWQFDDSVTTTSEQHRPVDRCPARSDDDFLDNENAEPAPPAQQQDKQP